MKMVQDSPIIERVTRNEEKTANLKEDLQELTTDFEKYKEKVEQDKKHAENVLMIKLSIWVAIITTLIALIFQYFFRK